MYSNIYLHVSCKLELMKKDELHKKLEVWVKVWIATDELYKKYRKLLKERRYVIINVKNE